MYNKLSAPSQIMTAIDLPASKSISNRVLIIHALANHKGKLINLSNCDDTRVMTEALNGRLHSEIDILAAGTAMRFLTAYLSATPGEDSVLTGTARMKQRPIKILVDALRQLGAKITYTNNEGYPPLHIKGTNLNSDTIKLNGNISSQYISALLMIGPTLPNGLRLELSGEIISRPYIDLTLQLMRAFGASTKWSSKTSITVNPIPYNSTGTDFTVESDWSGASYWYQMAALSPRADITLKGLFRNSYQGDSRGAKVFEKLGVATTFTSYGVRLTKSERKVSQLSEDFIDIPDLAQTFAVTCALLNVPFKFTGLQTLKIKETDRITALKVELRKLGYLLHDENDSVLSWSGERCEPDIDPSIQTYEDHRMAMAFAPASFYFPEMKIEEPHVVSKSYPDFWKDLKQAGFDVTENV